MVEVSKPRKRPAIVNPETGESGKFRRVQGRHVFEPSGEQEPSEIGDKELERWEHPAPSFKDDETEEKDKNTYGYGRPNDGSDPRPDETYRGTRGDAVESETYIGTQGKTDMDKLADTKLGDKIKYFDNGIPGDGTVVKMSGSYITLLKSDGYFQDIHINDTFHVSEIVKGKPWNKLSSEDRAEALTKARCPLSYITRNWLEIPEEARVYISKVNFVKSDVEHGVYGNVSTDTSFDADDDYEEDHKEEPKYKLDHSRSMVGGVSDKTKEDVEAEYNAMIADEKKGIEDMNDNTEKESMTTATQGGFNEVHNEKKPEKKPVEKDACEEQNMKDFIKPTEKKVGVPESSHNDYWTRYTKS
jgi:hypothetical protein